MTPRAVAKLSAPLLMIVAATMLVPLVLAMVDAQPRSIFAYGASAGACAFVALLLGRIGRGSQQELHRKDAIGVVVVIWMAMSIFGAMPFMLEGAIVQPTAALFEAVSGFTTSGGSVVANVEELSRASNLWRCEMHFIGGMGIVVLFVAVFPQLGVGAKQLFKNEVSGPTSEGMTPRIKQTAVGLWWIYTGLTALCGLLLFVAGMPVYDAICHSMSTLGSGGFSSKALSIGHYQSAAIDWITTGFMLVAGLNFGLYYAMVRGQWRALIDDPEARAYVGLNLVVILLVAWSIWSRHPSIGESLRYASFQVLAVTSTTGYMTEDFDAYPELARFLLFLCMFIGGCAGSTAGGMKVIRILLLSKIIAREVRSLAIPNVVETIKIGRQSIPPGVISGVLVFLATYMVIFALTSLLLVALDMDIISAMSGTVACMSSVGPGLNSVGPAQNFGGVPALGQLALSGCMIAGRLEIFVLLSIFSRELWRR
jgi:trk system potassium uptake protein TrkH